MQRGVVLRATVCGALSTLSLVAVKEDLSLIRLARGWMTSKVSRMKLGSNKN